MQSLRGWEITLGKLSELGDCTAAQEKVPVKGTVNGQDPPWDQDIRQVRDRSLSCVLTHVTLSSCDMNSVLENLGSGEGTMLSYLRDQTWADKEVREGNLFWHLLPSAFFSK